MATINWGMGAEDDPLSPPLNQAGPVVTQPFLPPAGPAPTTPPDPRMSNPTYAAQTDARNAWMTRDQGTLASLPSGPGWASFGGDYRRYFNSLVQGKPANSETLRSLEPQLKDAGIMLEPANAAGATHKLRLPNGRVVRVGEMFDAPGQPTSWGWVEQPAAVAGGASSYMAQFNDPSTQLLERYLTQQMSTLSAQQAAQEQANAGLRAKMPDIQASTDRLIAYLNQRATQLQSAPYTGTEQEILRTQALEPIERDRTAANQRALQQIGGRGLTPESGISQELMNQVNSVFDRARAGAHGDLAYRTVNEQRGRQQEAQQLLGLVPQIQRGAATGDLSLLQALDAAVNQPAQQAIGLATANQRLPSMAMDDAMSVMGMGGSSPDAVFQQAMGLYGVQNQQNQQGLGYYQMLGSMLPYLLQGGAR